MGRFHHQKAPKLRTVFARTLQLLRNVSALLLVPTGIITTQHYYMHGLLTLLACGLLLCAAVQSAQLTHDENRDFLLNLVEMAVTGSLFDEAGRCDSKSPGGCSKSKPFSEKLRNEGMDWPAVGHTMVGHVRIQNVKKLLVDVIASNVPGDFAELGVWRGGVGIFARCLLNAYHQSDRKVHLFDAFESLPGNNRAMQYLAVSESTVRHNFDKYGLKDGYVIHKGLFNNSVPPFAKEFTGNISVLRVDGNFYDSYQDAVYYLYDKVPVGGYVIFDDARSHESVMRFWLDFKKEQGLPEDLIPIDLYSAYFKKTKAIVTDFKYFRAPQDSNK